MVCGHALYTYVDVNALVEIVGFASAIPTFCYESMDIKLKLVRCKEIHESPRLSFLAPIELCVKCYGMHQ